MSLKKAVLARKLAEEKHKVWLLENGVVVCAGKVKGTVYEVPISWTFQQTQSFLEDLISSIKGI